MERYLTDTLTTWGGIQDVQTYELDRLFGTALTDDRFFAQLKVQPYQAVAQFGLTESEARAVAHIAPAATSVEDFAVQLDSWMTRRESHPTERCAEGTFIPLDSAAQRFSLPDDVLLKLVQEGKIRLSEQDVSQAAMQVAREEYA
jgi:hypothetical protein